MVLTEIENKMTSAVERVSESVVTIRCIKSKRGFGAQQGGSSGSGVIFDSIGHVVTNNHVVEGAAGIEVKLKDGRTYTATLVGQDKATDVALIKVDSGFMPAAKFGDSEKLKVAQMVLAMGNALDLSGAPTVSAGVLSAIGRPLPWADYILEGLLQTDAAINPGNSGGPLADLDGNVIGLNTAIIPFAQGMGFAIPSNTVKFVVKQILEKGKVSRPALGISVTALTPEIAKRLGLGQTEGVLIASVSPGGPAAAAGIREGDILESIGSHRIKSIKDIVFALSSLQISQEVGLNLIRKGREFGARLRLIEADISAR